MFILRIRMKYEILRRGRRMDIRVFITACCVLLSKTNGSFVFFIQAKNKNWFIIDN
jgi:hypothetical protein